MVDILIDTNIFIYREDERRVPQPWQQLERKIHEEGHRLLLHPKSWEDIRNDENEERRKRSESKLGTYAVLNFPTYPRNDRIFREHIPIGRDNNEKIDNYLLYSVYDEAVDYLITEDREIHKKAKRLGVSDRVLDISMGLDHFQDDETTLFQLPPIHRTKVKHLDPSDPLFDSVKEDYPGFEDWLNRIPERTVYITKKENEKLGSILIIKPNEYQMIGDGPKLPKKYRLKICTLKVGQDSRGQKIGELYINISIREAIENGNDDIYLTRHVRDADHLIGLISKYGFKSESKKNNGEKIFVKRLTPPPDETPSPVVTSQDYYPTFHDGEDVSKFLVPINPDFHDRLFPTFKQRQHTLNEFAGRLNPEGNAITKAYLSNSNIRKVAPGDLLIFYRINPDQAVTSIGVCERAEYALTDKDEIENLVQGRTVYTKREISEMAKKPTSVFLFRWHFDLNEPITFSSLLENNVVEGHIQSIMTIEESGYKYIKHRGDVDGRFVIN